MTRAEINRQTAVAVNSKKASVQTILQAINEEANKGQFRLQVNFEHMTSEEIEMVQHTLRGLGYNITTQIDSINIFWD